MKKKQYTLPRIEVAQITMPHLMDTSMTVLPPQVGAPKREPEVF